MKRMLALALALLMLGSTCVGETETLDYQAEAEKYFSLLLEGDYAAVAGCVAPEAREALTEDMFAQAMESLVKQMGEVQAWKRFDVTEREDYHIARILARYDAMNLMYRFTLDGEGRIAGFYASPSTEAFEEAPEASMEGIREEAVTLRAGEQDETNARLTLPEADGAYPVVILVHGSGPSDMDETIYANKPFRDIAHGLARLGVASLRYDKYTYAHADRIDAATFTVDDEYARDVEAAVKLLEGDARFTGVYLLGHSQGAMLLPRVMAKIGAERFKGGVLLAGSPKHLWEIQYEQNLAVLDTLEGEAKETAQAQIDAEVAKRDRLSTEETFFGIGARYQADEMSVDAAETARENGVPLLILQGDMDAQVSEASGIKAWKSALGEGAQYKLYEGLNHLFMASETGTVADYQVPGSVSEDVIADIAAWILGA